MEQLKKILKDKATVRWSILFLVAFVQATNYYFYDSLSPLKSKLEELYNFTSTDFGLFVSFYSIPNTFLLMAILGGIILDKLGIRRTGFSFVFLMAFGAILTAYGTSEYYRNGGFGYTLMNSFWPGYTPELKMMLLGRFMYGLGAETSIVVISKIIVKWFKGKELALAFGLKIGIARMGSFLAFNLSPRLVSASAGISIAIWFAAIFVGVGLLAFLIYMMFDLKLDRQMGQGKVSKGAAFKFSDLMQLLTNRSFIFVTILCVTFYSAVFPFQAYASDLFVNKFNMTPKLSGLIASILPLGTAIFTPLCGRLVDKKGKSATLMIYGSILLILVHLTLTFTRITPYIPIFVIGIAFSLVPAAMWPAVAKIVPSQRIGSAYGAMFSIQNLGLFLVPLLAGYVLDNTNKNAYTKLTTAESQIVINNNFQYNGSYLDNKGNNIKNKDLVVNYFIMSDNTKDAKVVWSEKQFTKTNNEGRYSSLLGEGEILNTKIKHLSWNDSSNIFIQLKSVENQTVLINEKIKRTRDYKYSFSLEQTKNLKNLEILLVSDSIATNVIWKEIQPVKINKNKLVTINLGQGEIVKANVNYIDLKPEYIIKVKTPLNYTLTVLIFVIIGLVALFFAFLLKLDDKKSGYGLEFPSNVKGEKSE